MRSLTHTTHVFKLYFHLFSTIIQLYFCLCSSLSVHALDRSLGLNYRAPAKHDDCHSCQTIKLMVLYIVRAACSPHSSLKPDLFEGPVHAKGTLTPLQALFSEPFHFAARTPRRMARGDQAPTWGSSPT